MEWKETVWCFTFTSLIRIREGCASDIVKGNGNKNAKIQAKRLQNIGTKSV